MSQTQNAEVSELIDKGDFARDAEVFTDVVVRNLELEFFPRIGFRAWHLFPTHDRDESNKSVRELSAFSIDPSLYALGDVSDTSHRLVIERPKHMLRVAVSPFEQQVTLPSSLIRTAKKKARYEPQQQQKVLIDQLKADKKIKSYPQFGILLDLDAYIEDPAFPHSLSVSDFIADAFADFTEVKKVVLAGRK